LTDREYGCKKERKKERRTGREDVLLCVLCRMSENVRFRRKMAESGGEG